MNQKTKTMSKIKLVILDAGHGGIIDGEYQTAGKRSPEWEENTFETDKEKYDNGVQYFEGVGNREIREEVSKILRKEGLRFRYTNEGEKDMPLKDRVARANHYHKKHKDVLLVSIHSDAFTKPEANGWSVFTTKGETLSDTYAEAMYEEMKKIFPEQKFRRDTTDGDSDKEEQFYILRKTTCPAILVENFFMTNEKECKEILMTKEGKRKIARAIANMVLRFVEGDQGEE